MNLQIRGKYAVITGGTKGIGAGIAKVLAEEGVNLALAYRSDSRGAKEFVHRLTDQYGIKAMAIQADLTVPAQVHSFYREVLASYPTTDILINNAAG